MANPTTNYGWPMPTSTDLVTDLPADFDAFGQPVDTTLKALNPETTLGDISYRSAVSNTNTRLGIGTAGQVLAVSGGVPAWTTTADVTPLTTKGDLFTFSTEDARIGVGADGTVLTAASGEATGLQWAAAGSTFVGCSASGLTTITNGGTTYSLTMTSENFDYTDPFHDNVTNPTRFTVPTGKGGYYQINVRISYDNASATPGFQKSFVRKNGTGTYSISSSSLILPNITTGTNQTSVGSGILNLAAADYIEVLVNTDNGSGTCNATLLLSISYIGA
jgi:hypothetical protein